MHPNATRIRQEAALREAEKAEEYVRVAAAAEAEKRALIERLARPSGKSDAEKLELASTIIRRAVLRFAEYVPDDSVLAWGITLDPRVWAPEKGDGVTFRIALGNLDKQRPQSCINIADRCPQQHSLGFRFRESD